MKSFRDRIDRTSDQRSLVATTEEGRQNYNQDDDDDDDNAAFLLQRRGRIDEAGAVYMDVHQRVLSSWHGNNALSSSSESSSHSSGSSNDSCQRATDDDVDLSASDVGQILEICCFHQKAITHLQHTIDACALPCPSLCSLLLLKLLWTRPDVLSEVSGVSGVSGEDQKEVFLTKDSPSAADQSNTPAEHRDWAAVAALLPLFQQASKEEKQKFRRAYKSHWKYYTMIQELHLRDRKLPEQLKMLTSSLSSQSSQSSPASAARREIFSAPPLWVVGDSHVVPLAHRRLCGRRTVPWVITGLKAWHVYRGSSFFTGANLERALQQLLSSSHSRSDSESSGGSSSGSSGGNSGGNSGALCDFILSAGEIDCREGFTNQISKGMYANVEEAVAATVKAYVAGVRRMLRSAQKEKEGGEEGKKRRNRLRAVYLLPVFPYQRRSKGRSGYHERMRRHRAIILWNHVNFLKFFELFLFLATK